MYNYYLNFMGLRTRLCASHKIEISEKLKAFLVERQTEFDYTISIQEKCTLPKKTEDGVWHGLEYYDCNEGEIRIFHFIELCGEPFAVTRFFADGDIIIEVILGYESFFDGSTGIFNRIGIEMLLLQHKGLILHSSLIEYHDKAVAFTGPSGIGKSTQAEIWSKTFGADIINGDRAAIRNVNNIWMAYGSPYAGTSGIYKNKFAPLSAVVVLRKAEENKLKLLSAKEAFAMIYPEISIHHWDKRFVSDVTDLFLAMLNDIPVYLLECLPNEDAATILKKGLQL